MHRVHKAGVSSLVVAEGGLPSYTERKDHGSAPEQEFWYVLPGGIHTVAVVKEKFSCIVVKREFTFRPPSHSERAGVKA